MISSPTRNEQFELPYGSYSISDIQYYFEYVLKVPSIKLYVNNKENRIIFKIR